MTANHSESNALASMPMAVHIGFAGARRLVPHDLVLDDEARAAFEADVARQLHEALTGVPRLLGLSDMHFLVGVSQMAVGADMLFSECIAGLGWGQRVFLPQQREAFLAALGSDGPDFTAVEAQLARDLLERTHVIEETVVTTASTRGDRFHDTNVAILAESDALVCLRVADRKGKAGGTQAVIDRAKTLDKAVLELVLHVAEDGAPMLQATFHPALDNHGQPRSVAPAFPATVPALEPPMALATPVCPGNWPALADYAYALKTAGSGHSKRRQALFRAAAAVVVGAHMAATLLALLAMTVVPAAPKWLLPAVLLVEVGLLLWGFMTHHWLQHGQHAERWAMARLCAEVGRSVQAYGRLPGPLRYLSALPMPDNITPLTRTLVVLHLRAVRGQDPDRWKAEIQRYLKERLSDPDPKRGQIKYYEGKQQAARKYSDWGGLAFMAMSIAAMLATGVKLGLKLMGLPAGDEVNDALAILAVLLPVMAVGVLSFIAALDMEARSYTFKYMHRFVERQARYISGAGSAGEAAASAASIESHLLGETVAWYSRRAYTNVA